jgi:hypothetical protein
VKKCERKSGKRKSGKKEKRKSGKRKNGENYNCVESFCNFSLPKHFMNIITIFWVYVYINLTIMSFH